MVFYTIIKTALGMMPTQGRDYASLKMTAQITMWFHFVYLCVQLVLLWNKSRSLHSLIHNHTIDILFIGIKVVWWWHTQQQVECCRILWNVLIWFKLWSYNGWGATCVPLWEWTHICILKSMKRTVTLNPQQQIGDSSVQCRHKKLMRYQCEGII